MAGRLIQTSKRYLRLAATIRWSRAFMAFLMLLGVLTPLYTEFIDAKAYALSAEAKKVLGSANRNLSAKFSYNQQANKWQFNKDGVAILAYDIAKQQGDKDIEGVASALSQLAAKQVGGDSKKSTNLYSVDLPVKAKQGISYYDNVTRLSFKMTPNFVTRDAKLVDGRIVYPFGGDGQVVYTAKNNGLKEDIVLSNYIGDTLHYSYSLDLPDTLEARLLDDGSIGIYSANPALFGNISFNNDDDKARVMEGRKNGTKDNLVFAIPAPIVKDQKGETANVRYELDGKKLTVVASGLKALQYPLSVDPSVTVTSASDFATDANEESNVDFGISANGDDVKRGALTGGNVGSWTSRTSIPASGTGSCGGAAQVYGVYSGYIYMVCNSSTAYAKLNTDGTINGSWQSGTTPPGAATNPNRSGFIYNGYVYITGGANGTGSLNNTYFAKLNANGGMAASWTPGTFLNTGRFSHGAVAYNGYAYVSGGATGTLTTTNTVERAPINGDGSLGTWTTTGTTALTGSGRSEHQMEIYNGYMYVTGGNGGGNEAVEYAKINSDGTMGSWSSTTTIPTGVNNPYRRAGSGIHNGYWYIVGGMDGGGSSKTTVLYAPIYASGQVGGWQTTTPLPTTESYNQFGVYNGYVFSFGGVDNNVYSAKIDNPGAISASNVATDFDTGGSNGRSEPQVVAALGYLYVLGGATGAAGGNTTNTVRRARICDGVMVADGCTGSSAAGSVGTWEPTATNSFSEARAAGAVLVNNGYLYLIGGYALSSSANCTRPGGVGVFYCSTIERASIDPSTGQLSWSGTYTYATTARARLGAVINNGYMYVVGGIYNNNSTESTEVDYGAINADGTLGSFNPTTSSMNNGHGGPFTAAAYNGKLYAVGSRNTHLNEYATFDSNGNITTGWTNLTNTWTGTDVQHATGTFSKGVFYMVGGFGGGNPLTQVVTAYIKSDGTLSDWVVSSNTMTDKRKLAGTLVYNDNLYVIGGDSTALSAPEKNVWYHRVYNGGSGETGAWTNRTSTATATYAQATASYNGYVYVLGGCNAVASSLSSCTGIQSTYTYASVDNSGTMGSWSAPANLPSSVPRYGLSAVAYNGYLYISGGCSTASIDDSCTTYQNDVYYAQINSSDGSLGTWTSGGTFTTGRYGHSMVVNNGYLYILGGCSNVTSNACTGLLSDVQYSQIGISGAPGSWSSAGTGFSTPRFYQAAVVNNNNLYVLGGCGGSTGANCTTVVSDIQKSQLNTSNGTLTGGWTSAGATPKPRFGLTANAYNGYLYITGGCGATSANTCSTLYKDIEYAPFTKLGLGHRWTKSTQEFSNDRLLHGTEIVNGYMVMMGGNASGTLQSQARTSPISVIDRVGLYSKLQQVPVTTDISSVYYSGSLDGGSSVQYRVAPSSGVFGSAVAATLGTGSEPTPLCGLGTIYYVQVMATIGDRTNAVFGDDSVSSLTDIYIYYRLNATPPPNLRLNGGKWFYSETQQGLDLCKQ